MKAVLPLILFSAVMLAGKADVVAPPAVASTATSETYSAVTCTGTDAGVNADILQVASDTRDQLGDVLKLGSKWLFPVHIIIVMPDDPLADKVKQERVGVFVDGQNHDARSGAAFRRSRRQGLHPAAIRDLFIVGEILRRHKDLRHAYQN